ncbi:MAG: CbiX/SirB N-terminal domain-containing protein, partial [Gammaproteobacteria bacterium]
MVPDVDAGARTGRAIVLVDHGSRSAAANQNLAAIAARLERRCHGTRVETAHMELAPPSLADAIATCAEGGAREIVVYPFFLAPGRHSRQDIPRLLREVAAAYPDLSLRLAEPLGVHEK